MKKMGSIITFIGMMVSIQAVCESGKEQTPMLYLISAMNEVDAAIESWSMVAKDSEGFQTDRKGYETFVNNVHNVANDFLWEKPSFEKHTLKLIATKQSIQGNVMETITILSHTSDDSYDIKMKYEMSGREWVEDRKNDIFSLFSTRTSELFSKKPQFFTCITGKISDKMEIALSDQAKQMMRHLDADFVESMEEKSFVSLSAYSKLWDTSIMTNDRKMNLQIALRNEGRNNSTRVLIGTPILTAEY